ncbi:hypothetical protein ACJX0J_031336, partial [Zea mays]
CLSGSQCHLLVCPLRVSISKGNVSILQIMLYDNNITCGIIALGPTLQELPKHMPQTHVSDSLSTTLTLLNATLRIQKILYVAHKEAFMPSSTCVFHLYGVFYGVENAHEIKLIDIIIASVQIVHILRLPLYPTNTVN